MYTKAARHMHLTVSFPGLVLSSWVSWYQKGKTSLNLNEARDNGVLGWQWHQLDHMQTICTSLLTDNHTNTSTHNSYGTDALPDAQPTVSKHWSPRLQQNGLHNRTITFVIIRKKKQFQNEACSKYTCDDNMQILDKFYDCNRNTHVYW